MPVVRNQELRRHLAAFLVRLRHYSAACLVGEVFTLTPATTALDLQPPRYAGYSPIELTSRWRGPFKRSEGDWSIDAGAVVFDPPAAGSALIYGWYVITEDGWSFGSVLQAPFNLQAGQAPYQLAVEFTAASRSVVPW